MWYERPMHARVRRRIIVAAAIVVGAAGVLALGLGVIYPRAGAWYVRSRVVPRLEAKLGRKVAIGDIDVSLGHAVLRDVTVRGQADGDAPLVRLDRIDVEFDTWSSLFARADVDRIDVRGGLITVRRDAAGTSNIDDLRTRLLGGGDAARGKKRGGLGRLRPRRASLSGVRLAATDEGRRLRGGADELTARYERGALVVTVERPRVEAELGDWLREAFGVMKRDLDAQLDDPLDVLDAPDVDPAAPPKAPKPPPPPATAAAERVVITDGPDGRTATITGGELVPWPSFALTGIRGEVRPAAVPGRVAIDVEGGYGGVEGKLWTARGQLDPHAETGELSLRAERFSLDRLRPILEHSSLVDYQKTTVDASLDLSFAGDTTTFTGGFHLHDLTIGHPLLAERPVPDVDVSGDVAGSVDRRTRTLALTRGDFVSRELPVKLTGTLSLPGGVMPTGATRDRAAFVLRFVVPPVPCQRALTALPPEMFPYMQGFKLKGTFSTDLVIAIDWADLAATQLGGSVAIRACRILQYPPEMERLEGTFEHFVEVERDKWLGFLIGPENPDFVPIAEVSPNLLNSLMTTEDSAFYQHRGYIAREFRTALIKNLQAGYFRYGASSITMQTVKNVLLYREKTLTRKLQELFLTYAIELRLEKDRIFEIYVNAIEYGPGLYGIGPAARHYFGVAAKDLTPKQAAFFSSILPSPKARYRQYCKGTLTKWTGGKIERILGLMLKRGRLTQEEYIAAMAEPLVFVKDGSETEVQCNQRVNRALKNARPTNPLKKK